VVSCTYQREGRGPIARKGRKAAKAGAHLRHQFHQQTVRAIREVGHSMGVWYTLVNFTRREHISFLHVGGFKFSEIVGNPISATLVTYYMLKHAGDQIAFVADTEPVWPFPSGSYDDLAEYTDVTDTLVDELVEYKYLADDGREYLFDDEPDIYTRRLRLFWNEW
jgi:hypothetical protein